MFYLPSMKTSQVQHQHTLGDAQLMQIFTVVFLGFYDLYLYSRVKYNSNVHAKSKSQESYHIVSREILKKTLKRRQFEIHVLVFCLVGERDRHHHVLDHVDITVSNKELVNILQ